MKKLKKTGLVYGAILALAGNLAASAIHDLAAMKWAPGGVEAALCVIIIATLLLRRKR